MPGTPHTEVRKQLFPPWSWHSGGRRRREKRMERKEVRKEENRKGRREGGQREEEREGGMKGQRN